MTIKPKAPALDRSSAESARRFVETKIPDAARRRKFLEIFAAVIERAHAHGGRLWSVTLLPTALRLNVGRVMVMELTGSRDHWLPLDTSHLGEEEKQWLENRATLNDSFRSIPDLPLYCLAAGDYFEILPRVQDALLAFVDRAARTARSCPYASSYSPGVLKYLEQELGRKLPRIELPPSEGTRETEFEDLFEEFIDSYWVTDKGQKHCAGYEAQRLSANINWDLVNSSAEEGKDVTDLVLDGLLPHADTQGNQERGSWVHLAPAITKDVRSWFEGAGWVKAEDWLPITHAIVHFIGQCLKSPDDAQGACEEFADSPLSKGFQTGMLSPILNALDPENFLIVNSKVLKVLRYYTATELGARIEDYDALNHLGQEFIAQHLDLLHREETKEYRPGDVFDQFCHWLVGENDAWPPVDQGKTQYWKIAPGKNAHLWDECQKGAYICIGWDRLGDVSEMTREEFSSRVEELQEEDKGYTVTATNQLWNFSRIPVGSYILANKGHSQIMGVGRVIGAYTFVDGTHPHQLPVDWYDVEPKPITQKGWNKTMVRLNRKRFIELGCREKDPPIPGGGGGTSGPEDPEIPVVYSLAACAEETGFAEAELRRWVRAIERKGQAIFYGPPGTGKTYLAERLAKHFVGGGHGFAELIQFHPSYAYEDFIQGIRPITQNGSLTFKCQDGRFLEFCTRAAATEDPCVLILDEINRAELSRVFGELMYLLEYRDKSVPLAGGGTLRIPSNVRILGTMNTADRSIALVDHALRRRFAFLPLKPRMDILASYHEEQTGFAAQGLVSILEQLNTKIGDQNYAVGISFFLRKDIENEIEDIWCMEIVPYLEEFFFDQEEAVESFRWIRVRDQILP